MGARCGLHRQCLVRYFLAGMTTLAEIEKAAAALSAEQQAVLLRHLERNLARQAGAEDGWPVPPPSVPLEELQRIHALIDAEFSGIDGENR